MSQTIPLQEASPYVTYVGTEYEFSLLEAGQAGAPGKPFEPDELQAAIELFVADESAETDGAPGIAYAACDLSRGGYMRGNGDRPYVDRNLPEISHPENPSLRDNARRIRRGEKVAVGVAKELLGLYPDVPAVLIQMQGGDSENHTVGVHDNALMNRSTSNESGAADELEITAQYAQQVEHLLSLSAITRVFMTGLGVVDSHGFGFSGKLAALARRINAFTGELASTKFTSSRESEGKLRAEERTAEPNLNDGVVVRRLGSMVVTVALGQTPLYEQAVKWLIDRVPGVNLHNARVAMPTDYLELFNRPVITPDGYFEQPANALHSNACIRTAVEFELEKMRLFLEELPKTAGPAPVEQQEIAHDIQAYCRLALRALDGEIPVSALSRKSDWAAKYSVIYDHFLDPRRTAERERRQSAILTAEDYAGMYGLTTVRQDGRVHYGIGHSLRDRKQAFDDTFSPEEIEAAYRQAPPGRASLRGGLISRGLARAARWSRVIITVPTKPTAKNPSGGVPRNRKIELPHADQMVLTAKQQELVDRAEQYRSQR